VYLLINGAFGIGKTTVARLLKAATTGAAIHDPERAGFILRRLPAWVIGEPRQPDDYQNLAIWRRMAVSGARRAHRRAGPVIMPMAFSDPGWFGEVVGGLAADAPVRVFCLTAPLVVVRERIERRAAAERWADTDWVLRRAEECCAAHAEGAFGELVDATPSPEAIVADLQARLTLGTACNPASLVL